jgi:hypothetical protein
MLRFGYKLRNWMRSTSSQVPAIQRASTLASDKKGVAALEFGFVAIPFFALLVASLYTSLSFFTQSAIESATQDAARLLITGQPLSASGRWDQAKFKAKVCESLPDHLDCDRLYIDVRAANSIALIDLSMPAFVKNSSSGSSGSTLSFDDNGRVSTSGEYELPLKDQKGMVRLIYIWSYGTGPLGVGANNLDGDKQAIIATSIFTTEPFGP